MVLSAGLGTRMAPANGGRSRSRLCALNGKALIDHVLDRHAEAGIMRAVVNVHHKADLIEAHLKGRRAPAYRDLRRAERAARHGRRREAGASTARSAGPFLIHNANSVWIEGVGSNLARLMQAWDDERMDCLMLLALASHSLGYQGRGDFAFEATAASGAASSRRSCRSHSPACRWRIRACSTGSPEGAFSLNAVWNTAIAAGRAYGMRMEGTWMHVGSPDALAQAEQQLTREIIFLKRRSSPER